MDPQDPFTSFARANSWTPPLNTTWQWGVDRINGVNLGGLFVLEPYITPAFYQRYTGAVDEFTLSQMMAADTANGGLSQLEKHYDTFIVSNISIFRFGCGRQLIMCSNYRRRWTSLK